MPLKPTTAMHKDRRTGKDSVRMQHRHFAFIASVIGTSGERPEDKRRWANYFAQELAKTNPNFDRARFFTAVGVDDPYITQAAYPEPWIRPRTLSETEIKERLEAFNKKR